MSAGIIIALAVVLLDVLITALLCRAYRREGYDAGYTDGWRAKHGLPPWRDGLPKWCGMDHAAPGSDRTVVSTRPLRATCFPPGCNEFPECDHRH